MNEILNSRMFDIVCFNCDPLKKLNNNFKNFIDNNDLVNFVYQPTRVCSRFHKRRNQYLQSESFIDLFLHNADLVDETCVIDCPFSDHKFVLAKLTVAKLKCKQKTILCRNLSLVNTENICTQIDEIDWSGFKNFSLMKNGCLNSNYLKQFKLLNDEKLFHFFQDKTLNDFKNAKKFWQFYSPLISMKSDKNSNTPLICIKNENEVINDKLNMCEIFNKFFTSIRSSSELSNNDSKSFIQDQFSKLGLMKAANFRFSFTNRHEIEKLLSEISTSSGIGSCGIPIKILKGSSA
ncbi:RNA-directed DNA polymerase from mobile element jockey [Brachionus plicatilis]|uniref:RNA-directed DNA polymerase from mobile element jockey n=1 Tax=Brachionus plicatilis TaxID=10195 RepID=A0A3M7Q4M8_BRAPC|nr:RNA-directed DNA polymerase from mobile element jockey [Brachionus plicatilis]